MVGFQGVGLGLVVPRGQQSGTAGALRALWPVIPSPVSDSVRTGLRKKLTCFKAELMRTMRNYVYWSPVTMAVDAKPRTVTTPLTSLVRDHASNTSLII